MHFHSLKVVSVFATLVETGAGVVTAGQAPGVNVNECPMQSAQHGFVSVVTPFMQIGFTVAAHAARH